METCAVFLYNQKHIISLCLSASRVKKLPTDTFKGDPWESVAVIFTH